MLAVLLLIVRSLLVGLGSRRELLLENLALRHQLQVALRTNPHPRLRPRDRVLWVWLHGVWARWLAAAFAPGTAGDRPPLAPQGLASLLDLEVANQAGPATVDERGARAHRPDLPRESALGQRANSWRTAQARHRRQQPLHPALPV